jgi:lipid-binding SYLF domain-containing protein
MTPILSTARIASSEAGSSSPSAAPRPVPGTGLWRRVAAALLALGLVLASSLPAQALTRQEEVIEQSRLTLIRLMTSQEFPQLSRYLANARGVLIVPELVRGGFVLGAEGGTGVLVLRQPSGGWGQPTFVSLAAGSIGLQVGGQVSQVVMTLMTDEAVVTMLSDEFTLGADANVAFANVGAGIEAGTALDRNADIYAFSFADGLFVGAGLEGTVISEIRRFNEAYYGSGATAEQVRAGLYVNPHANILLNELP